MTYQLFPFLPSRSLLLVPDQRTERVRSVFDNFDNDKNGSIDEEELYHAL